jgi:hypothetical protein
MRSLGREERYASLTTRQVVKEKTEESVTSILAGDMKALDWR